MVTVSGKANRNFQRGGRGVYTCACCGRRTRETTVQGSDLCAECFELAGLQNMVWDGEFKDHDRAERDRLAAKIVSLGGNLEKVKEEFVELFAA